MADIPASTASDHVEQPPAEQPPAEQTPAEKPPAVKRDQDFYLPYGNMVLKAENTLFKLESSILCSLSGFFHDMRQLPQGHGQPEGLTDDNPIVLPPQVTAEAFSNLIRTAIHVIWSAPPHPYKRYLDVLELAKLFLFPDHVIDGAVHELQKYSLRDFTPVDRIFYARKHDIKEFIAPAFKELCKRYNLLKALTQEDCRKLGISVYEVLAKVKTEIEITRSRVAWAPYENIPIHASCRDHGKCKKAWAKAWYDTMMPKILDPSCYNALRFPDEVQDAVEAIEAPEMTVGCKDMAIKHVTKADGPMLSCERLCVEAGVAELMRRFEDGKL